MVVRRFQLTFQTHKTVMSSAREANIIDLVPLLWTFRRIIQETVPRCYCLARVKRGRRVIATARGTENSGHEDRCCSHDGLSSTILCWRATSMLSLG